ncbi:alpha-amylase family glycosyl hydrolase [Pantoea sp.]|uniref:alpha-amylase family glycosyl hydrolase n=1 Tax=Pantoea sp. TaxID=69393 RepID=UPI00390C4CFA
MLFLAGVTWSATPETARLCSDPAREELSMVFQFEHITQTWDAEYGKWRSKPFNLMAFKKDINKWQNGLAKTGWNSLFWSNHDLPRAVSKFGDPHRYRIESAKLLANLLHGLKGTPYIYQGEETGITNMHFDGIEACRNIESLNHYEQYISTGLSPEEMMAGICANGRDNARTPVQWNAQPHASFTCGEP